MEAKAHADNPALNTVSIETLEECYRHELSAVETYELALGNITNVGTHRVLQEILTSHATRMDRLRRHFADVGAAVPQGSGVWGTLVKAVQTGADILGDRAAIAVLEEGEDRSLKLYLEAVQKCDPDTRQLIESELLPAERRTHELCRNLKQYLQTPS